MMERVRNGQSAAMRELSLALPSPGQPSPVNAGVSEPAPAKPDIGDELKQLRESAVEEGYRQGVARARQEIDAAVAKVRQELERAHAAEVEGLESARERMKGLAASIEAAVTKAGDEVVPLAIEVGFMAATRVLGELAERRELVAKLCQQALGEHPHRPVVVRVAPIDLAELKQAIFDDGVSVEADATMKPGSCRLETRRGDYETSLDERLEGVRQALLRAAATTERTP